MRVFKPKTGFINPSTGNIDFSKIITAFSLFGIWPF